MKYYKVKRDANDIQMGNGWASWKLISNELVTEAEAKKRNWDLNKLMAHSEIVELSRKCTFFSFGARFIKSNYNYNQQ